MLTSQAYLSVLRFLRQMPTRNGTLLRDILQLFEQHFHVSTSLAVTYQKDPDSESALQYNYIVRDLPPNQVSTYMDQFVKFDIRSRLKGKQKKSVVSLTALLSPEERAHTPYYQYLRSLGIAYQCCIFLRKERELYAMISLFRPEAAGDFTPEELEIFSEIEPFITNQYLENRKNREMMSLAYHFDEYFSHLSLGVALLDHNGKILKANHTFNDYAQYIYENGSIVDSFVTRDTADTPEHYLWGQKLLNYFGSKIISAPEEIKVECLLHQFKFYSKEISNQSRTVINPGQYLYLIFLIRQEKVHSPQMLAALKQLTSREKAVLDHLSAGLNNTEIADAMDISPFTVKTHLQNIYAKCGVSGRNELLSKLK